MSKKNITLDLHPIYNKGDLIDDELENAFKKAEKIKAKELEIICGKGSGALKKRVLRFLQKKEIKEKYHRVNKDKDNWGRIFVYFRWERKNKAQ